MKEAKIPEFQTHPNFALRPLYVHQASELCALLRSQPPGYIQYFKPFLFDEDTLRRVLSDVQRDVFQGLYHGDRLIGLMMLRGWDEGYEVPTLGVMIDEQHRNHGLMTLTVEVAKVICRMRKVGRIMYKAHPDNVPAKSATRLGFTQTGVDNSTGYLIFHMNLDSHDAR
ncbi:MAG: GNAT family N-acetyltransferase [Acidobacteriota bacterium]|nr:GNAT family N-acetyltransferase [Acidobacteriota bacterium]